MDFYKVQHLLTTKNRNMKTTFFYRYITHRARIRKEELNYTQSEIEEFFNSGIRNIAGVELNNEGFPLYDDAPPEYHGVPAKHFLNNYIYWELIHKGPIN